MQEGVIGRESRRKEQRRLQRIEDALFGPDELYANESHRAVSDVRLAIESATLGIFLCLSFIAALPLDLGSDVLALRLVGYGGVWAAGLYAWFQAKRRRKRVLTRAWVIGLAVWAGAFSFLF